MTLSREEENTLVRREIRGALGSRRIDWRPQILQRRMVPDPGPLITDTAGGAEMARIGISYEDAVRFVNALDTIYGLKTGSMGWTDAIHDEWIRCEVTQG